MRIGPAVTIYKVHTRHTRYGNNWASYTLAARNATEAIRKSQREFTKGEKLEWIEPLATTAD